MPAKGPIVAVTGVSGYLGNALAGLLEADERVERIIGVDCRPPRMRCSKLRFFERNITDSGLDELFVREGVTHAAHLAFHLAPNHDDRRTREINVGGTRRMLEAAAACGLRQLVFASSSVVYGAHADNAPAISEDSPLRPCRQVQYTLDKVEAEQLCREFRGAHPEMELAMLRVVTIVGPGTDNFITRFLQKPLLVLPWGFDPPWQFVHELDCARAFHTALFSHRSGTYNLGADDPIRFSEIVAPLKKPVIRVPRALLKFLTNVCWHARQHWLAEIPGALIDYLCYPPVLDNRRLKQELDFDFHYTSREAIRSYLENRF